MLTPPVELLRPVKVAALPSAPPGSLLIQIKVDGWRAAAFVGGAGVVLQARSGRDVTARFPEIVAPLSSLPPGAVLDGEIVAVTPGGAFEFTALARSVAWRREHSVSVAYQAFDLLAKDGDDWRGRPLSQRWVGLVEMLETAPSAIQPVLSTTDRAEAIGWMGTLRRHGVEGLVSKPVRGLYGPLHGWAKVREADTLDAEVLGVLGAPRPRALRVRVEDGRVAVTEPLGPVGSRAVATALAAQGLPLTVEVRAGIGRHAQVRFVRIRPAD